VREFNFKVRGGGANGLVPDPHYPIGAEYASRMRNLRPSEFAAINPEWFTAPFAFTLDWPFPQIHRGEAVTLLLKRTGVSTLATNWAETALTPKQSTSRATNATVTAGGVWHTATFEDSWFATNGESLLFKTPAHPETLMAVGLKVATLCAHDDRLVLVGLEGDWFSSARFIELFDLWRSTQTGFSHDQMTWSNRWAVWGEPRGGSSDIPFWMMLIALGVFGNDAYDALKGEFRARIERGELGFASIRKLGAPQACKSFGSDIAIYSKEARVSLRAQGQGYAVAMDNAPGVFNRGAISGDAFQHAWITPSRELVSQAYGGEVRDLRQEHRFTGSLTNLAASYDPTAKEHWFATENWAYVLGRWGLGGPMDVRPTSLFRADGALVGAGSGLGATHVAVSLYSHLLNMGYQGSKRVQLIEVEQQGLTDVLVDVEATDDATAPFSLGPEQTNEMNIGFIIRSGDRFQVGVQGTAPIGGSYAIPAYTVRYHPEDLRFRRGTSGTAQDG